MGKHLRKRKLVNRSHPMLYHRDGRIEPASDDARGTVQRLGLNWKTFSCVLRGKYHSTGGWALTPIVKRAISAPRAPKHHPTLYHKDGRIEPASDDRIGTARRLGIDPPKLLQVMRGECHSTRGWYISFDALAAYAERLSHPALYHTDGSIEPASDDSLLTARRLALSPQRLRQLVNGRIPSLNGWYLTAEDAALGDKRKRGGRRYFNRSVELLDPDGNKVVSNDLNALAERIGVKASALKVLARDGVHEIRGWRLYDPLFEGVPYHRKAKAIAPPQYGFIHDATGEHVYPVESLKAFAKEKKLPLDKVELLALGHGNIVRGWRVARLREVAKTLFPTRDV